MVLITTLIVGAIGAGALWLSQHRHNERNGVLQAELRDAALREDALRRQVEELQGDLAKPSPAPKRRAGARAETARLRAQHAQLMTENRRLRTELSAERKKPVPTPVILIKVSQARKKSAREHLATADQLFSEGNVEAARLEYLSATKLNPNLANAYLKLGMIHEVSDHKAAALEYYERFLALRPAGAQSAEATRRAAQLFDELGPTAEIFEIETEMEPDATSTPASATP